MKIYFLGLSCFLIENKTGHTILVDPFDDTPQWTLGPIFPRRINRKPLGANIVLMSEPDTDHARAPGGLLQNAPATKPHSNPFPNLDLRGTVVYEYNGDVNIAWHYTMDGVRLAHFADNAHCLTREQLKEIGHPDIIFVSPPKTKPENRQALDMIRKNIALLKPKIIVWAHHIAPKNLPRKEDSTTLRKFFARYFKNNAYTNIGYKDESSLIELSYILESAYALNQEYHGIILPQPYLEINKKLLTQGKNKPVGILFRSMVARSGVE